MQWNRYSQKSKTRANEGIKKYCQHRRAVNLLCLPLSGVKGDTTPMAPWTKFKVGTPAAKGFNPDCQQFSTVSHTSHVDVAISIIDRGEIRPYLVSDESILNDRRILVSWLSPNFWGTGFRYGNIKFDFEFNSLIEEKRFYWVESIAYKIPACRILVTDKDHADLKGYDPTSKKGPWWHDSTTDTHYYNGTYCLEFMFEDAISMDHLRTLDFVDHHSSYCAVHRNNPTKCTALGHRRARGGAIFLARLATSASSLEQYSSQLVRENGRPNSKLEFAFEELRHRASRNITFTGSLDLPFTPN
jgi:hypothetical protein